MQPHSEAGSAPFIWPLAFSWAMEWCAITENVDDVAGRLCLCCDEFAAIMQGRLTVEDASADLMARGYIDAPEIIGKMGGRRTLLHIAYVVAAVRFAEAIKLAGLGVKGLEPGWHYDREGHVEAIEDLTRTTCAALKPTHQNPSTEMIARRLQRYVAKTRPLLDALKLQKFRRRTGKFRELTAFEKDLRNLLFRAAVADQIPESPKAIQKAWRLWRSNPDSL